MKIDSFLIEGFSLHEREDTPIPNMINGMVRYEGLIRVEAGSHESFDGTYHYGLLEAKRVLVNPPGVVKILQEMELAWVEVLALGDGVWNSSTGRGKVRTKFRNKYAQIEVEYSEEMEFLARIRSEHGQVVVKVVNIDGDTDRTQAAQAIFARPSYDELYDELQVYRVMDA